MKRDKYLYLILLVLAVVGCKHVEIPTYSGESYLQFDAGTKTAGFFSFVYSGAETRRDTVYFKVKIVGSTADYDRVVRFKQVPEYGFKYEYDEDGILVDSALVAIGNQAIAGKHYVGFDAPEIQHMMVVKAGKDTANIGIILIRDMLLKQNSVRLSFEIGESKDFKIGDVDSYKAVLEISDILNKPRGWNHQDPGGSTHPSQIWGTYGAVKHQFMIDVSPNGEKWDDEFFLKLNQDEGLMRMYVNIFKRELDLLNKKRNDAGLDNLREDPNNPNTEITFP